MHLLYLDDSGSTRNQNDKHIVLAGVAVPERQPHWLSEALERLAEEVWPDSPNNLEFRGSDMFSGRRHWRGHEFDKREEVYCKALSILARSNDVRVFGVAAHRQALSPEDPMEYAFEAICNRFDRMLLRLHRAGDTQRGLLIIDKSSYETSLQRLAVDFKREGHRWGTIRNFADVPLFVDSRATRMIQFADLVAYAFRQYFEHGQAKYIDIIRARIDSEGGVYHEIHHRKPQDMQCVCIACRK